jgi:hypothetical protein
MPILKERATRQYFVEKMTARLSQMWQQNQTNNNMYIRIKWQYHRFINKIDELDETILNMVPMGTDSRSLPRIKITEY